MSERRERGQINKNMQQINHYVRRKATPYTDQSMLRPLHCHRPSFTTNMRWEKRDINTLMISSTR